MKKKGWIVFDKDDKPYKDWVKRHPDGYVLNMRREMNPKYRVLHTASCPTITEYNENAKEGGFTERIYIKVCAEDLESLKDWSQANGRPDGSFSGKHSQCKPS